MMKNKEPMIVPGLENEVIVALAVGAGSALFATEEGKLFFIHVKFESEK